MRTIRFIPFAHQQDGIAAGFNHCGAASSSGSGWASSASVGVLLGLNRLSRFGNARHHLFRPNESPLEALGVTTLVLESPVFRRELVQCASPSLRRRMGQLLRVHALRDVELSSAIDTVSKSAGTVLQQLQWPSRMDQSVDNRMEHLVHVASKARAAAEMAVEMAGEGGGITCDPLESVRDLFRRIVHVASRASTS